MQVKFLFGIPACLAICALAVSSIHGQTKNTENTLKLDNGAKSAPATLEDIEWLVGAWEGKGLGGWVDEQWTQAKAGTMVGTFRLVQDDKLVFSEFFVIFEENGSLVLRLKHFNPDMNGWEAKDKYVEFPLVKVQGKTVWFSGLTYRLDDEGMLNVYVAMKQPSGDLSEGAFKFKKRSD